MLPLGSAPLRDGFSIEVIYKPFVPDNVTNLRVFNDDQQVLDFMLNTDIFKDAIMEEEDHDRALQEELKIRKEKPVPKGVVSLKKLFDLQNHL